MAISGGMVSIVYLQMFYLCTIQPLQQQECVGTFQPGWQYTHLGIEN